MISSNYYKCSESDLIRNVSENKRQLICELGDRKLMQLCKKNTNGAVDWRGHLDIDKYGRISLDSFYSSVILAKRNNTSFTALINSEHSITKIHCDILNLVSDVNLSRKCNIILFLSTNSNCSAEYLSKLLKTVAVCKRNKNSVNIYIYIRELNVCVYIYDSSIIKNCLSKFESIKKVQFVECINSVSQKITSAIESCMKYKQLFINSIEKYISVVPHAEYMNSYNESFRLTTVVVMDNKIANRWLTISIINTLNPISSSKLKISEVTDKDISFTATNNFDPYIKCGFCSIDFLNITSAAKVNSLIKQILLSIEKIYPDITKEIKYHNQSDRKSRNDKKVRFSSKIYITDINSNSSIDKDNIGGAKPIFSVKKYKNGKPIGILKKKSNY